MEYLMTYGWAILIIAVVLVALSRLGLSNANTLGPRPLPAPARSTVPMALFSTTYISLQGISNTEPPQYVAQSNNTGSATYIVTGSAGLPLGNNPKSVFAWVYTRSYTTHTRPSIYDYGTYSNYQRSGYGLGSGGAVGFSGFFDDVGGSLQWPWFMGIYWLRLLWEFN